MRVGSSNEQSFLLLAGRRRSFGAASGAIRPAVVGTPRALSEAARLLRNDGSRCALNHKLAAPWSEEWQQVQNRRKTTVAARLAPDHWDGKYGPLCRPIRVSGGAPHRKPHMRRLGTLRYRDLAGVLQRTVDLSATGARRPGGLELSANRDSDPQNYMMLYLGMHYDGWRRKCSANTG